MTSFNIEINKDIPDHIFVEVDRRFDVAIERTPVGLSFRIYPRTGGELWGEPFTTFEVLEADVLALEAALRDTS
ncbi:hypothetical protein SH668x_000049 [Planctomicrobium sp. SH668]|uniref:hypothetical protein n=1 Tax=Planctomicrobium sp. SH668 TaxID=3448126 RepID=UPI003F5BEAD2